MLDNYQTKEMPSNQNVPLFVRGVFGDFYKSVFSRTWTNNKSSAFLEYSWDLNGSNFTKCDPCNTTPPASQELLNAGVDWLNTKSRGWGATYSGKLHFTRLHVRYDRAHFPQDLMFTETKNKQNFQCRYVLQNPAHISDESCSEVLPYYKRVLDRRNTELETLEKITWWKKDWYKAYPQKYEDKIARLEAKSDDEENNNSFLPIFPKGNIPPMILLFVFGLSLTLISILTLGRFKKA